MIKRRYWGLFCIAVTMAAHSAIVGRLLESSFFMMLFFWGWVAAAALQGRLESALSMSVAMMVILPAVTATTAYFTTGAPSGLAYYTFALYPAFVSWVCLFFYVRYLQQTDANDSAQPPQMRRTA